MSRGGKREGAGRKPIPDAKIRTCQFIHKDTAQKLKELKTQGITLDEIIYYFCDNGRV